MIIQDLAVLCLIHIKMVFENEFVKLFNAKIVEGIKGEMTEEFSIFPPSDVNIT